MEPLQLHQIKHYVLVSFYKPREACLSEQITLKLGHARIRYLCAPVGVVNQAIILLEAQEKPLRELKVEAEVENSTMPIIHHVRPISEAFANHLIKKAIRECISKDLFKSLDTAQAWQLYLRFLAGELSRPRINHNSPKEFCWNQVCNYNTLPAQKAISRVTRYKKLKSTSHGGEEALDVSVIIPTYGQIHYTACCLLSVLEDRRRNFPRDKIKSEIIVVDDCFPDKKEIEPLLHWHAEGMIKLIAKQKNSGFIESCNQGAKAAKGRCLVFLNNDTEVFDNWLEELIAPLADSEVGLTGSKLIYPDGTLQEAGGIIWANGNAWNYGRGSEDPFMPEFSYLREVDYVSGASIGIRRSDFDRMNGFSEEFKPAYCEDSDLALRIRYELGKRVVFNPFSLVVHHEGKSCGTSLESGVKRYQVENTKKLFKKWRDTLIANHNEDATDVFHARGRSGNKKTVLVIDHYIPEPDRDAGSRTMTSFIEAILMNDCKVVLWPDNLNPSNYLRHFQKMGVEVLHFTDKQCPVFCDWIMANGQYIDVALVSRPQLMAKYVTALKQNSKADIVFYGHDLHHCRIQAEHSVKIIKEKKEQLELLKSERYAWDEAFLILYPTAWEADVVRNHIHPKTNVQSIQAYSIKPTLRSEKPHQKDTQCKPFRLLFVGGFRHSPNVDAMQWFCEAVFPKILTELDCQLMIAGSHPPDEIQNLSSDKISVLGFVEDSVLEDLYASCDLAIVPLRYGAGIKGKVIEAFSKGIPVVTTDIGMQGIDWPEQIAYIGNSAEEFAVSTLQALSDQISNKDRFNEYVSSAQRYIAFNYSEESMVKAWMSVLKGTCQSGKR